MDLQEFALLVIAFGGILSAFAYACGYSDGRAKAEQIYRKWITGRME